MPFKKGYRHSVESRRKISEAGVGRNYSLETREKIRQGKMGSKNPMWGKTPSLEVRKKMSERLLGNTYTLGMKFSEDVGKKHRAYRHTDDARKRISAALSLRKGDKHPMFGKPVSVERRMKQSKSLIKRYSLTQKATPINKRIRQSIEMRLWREVVFARDNYTCVLCGEKGCTLNADHIKRFAEHPELRFAIDNGRTLCVPCHKKTPTYGGKKQYATI